MANLTINAAQDIFLNKLNSKFKAFVAGYGSGKTYTGALNLGVNAAKFPKIVQGYFAPTYPLIRDIFYSVLEEAIYPMGFRLDVKEGNKEVHLYRNGTYYGIIICRSMDNPSTIVGFNIVRALIDEIDVMPKDKATAAWRKIIARLKMRVNGLQNGIDVVTTPEGFLFTYDTFGNNPSESYSMVQASTYENAHNLPDDYIPALIESYPPELIDAYLFGKFVNLKSGTVYKSYNRVRNRSTETIKEKEPLFIGQDFNVTNMCSCIFVKRQNGWHCVKELTGIYDTPALIETVKELFKEHHITIYPDASGKSRKSVNASTSDIALLSSAGFTVKVKESNPAVKDRVLSVNACFDKQNVYVNDVACPETARCLEQQSYDKNGEPDKSQGHDHQNDAFGYPIAFEFPVRKPLPNINFSFQM